MIVVLTIDQRGSRHGDDLVPELLNVLAPIPARLDFERTAGDELQGALDDPLTLPQVLELLLRDGRWNVGLGFGVAEIVPGKGTRAAEGLPTSWLVTP